MSGMATMFLLIMKDVCSCAAVLCDQASATSTGFGNVCEQGAVTRRPPAGHAAHWSCHEHLRNSKTYAAVSCTCQHPEKLLHIVRPVPGTYVLQHPSPEQMPGWPSSTPAWLPVLKVSLFHHKDLSGCSIAWCPKQRVKVILGASSDQSRSTGQLQGTPCEA